MCACVTLLMNMMIINNATRRNSMSITTDFFKRSKIEKNQTTIDVMDFLSSAETVNKMIVASEMRLPVLTPIVKELEDKFGNSTDFPLNHNGKNQNATNRQNIGRMIKFIMRQFGYIPVDGGLNERARIPQCAESKYFSTSAIYSKMQKDKYKIEVKII